MIGIFKQKAPGNVVLLLILGLMLKWPLFLYPKMPIAVPADGKLYALIVAWINSSGGPILSSILAFLLIYIQALLLTGVINGYRMTLKQTFLPAMSYLLITSLFPEWNFLSAPLIAATFIIGSCSMLFQLYNDSSANSRIYNIGLLLGIASFFYFPSVFFSVCLIMGILILRSFSLNETLLLILGILTPYYFFAVYLFLIDQLAVNRLIPPVYIHIPKLTTSLWAMGSIMFITVPFLTGGYYVQANLRKMLIQARKNWSIVLLYSFFSLFIAFINSNDLFTNWVVAIAPFAAFHACSYFYTPRKWVSNLLFIAIVAFILVQQYIRPLWQ